MTSSDRGEKKITVRIDTPSGIGSQIGTLSKSVADMKEAAMGIATVVDKFSRAVSEASRVSRMGARGGTVPQRTRGKGNVYGKAGLLASSIMGRKDLPRRLEEVVSRFGLLPSGGVLPSSVIKVYEDIAKTPMLRQGALTPKVAKLRDMFQVNVMDVVEEKLEKSMVFFKKKVATRVDKDVMSNITPGQLSVASVREARGRLTSFAPTFSQLLFYKGKGILQKSDENRRRLYSHIKDTDEEIKKLKEMRKKFEEADKVLGEVAEQRRPLVRMLGSKKHYLEKAEKRLEEARRKLGYDPLTKELPSTKKGLSETEKREYDIVKKAKKDFEKIQRWKKTIEDTQRIMEELKKREEESLKVIEKTPEEVKTRFHETIDTIIAQRLVKYKTLDPSLVLSTHGAEDVRKLRIISPYEMMKKYGETEKQMRSFVDAYVSEVTKKVMSSVTEKLKQKGFKSGVLQSKEFKEFFVLLSTHMSNRAKKLFGDIISKDSYKSPHEIERRLSMIYDPKFGKGKREGKMLLDVLKEEKIYESLQEHLLRSFESTVEQVKRTYGNMSEEVAVKTYSSLFDAISESLGSGEVLSIQDLRNIVFTTLEGVFGEANKSIIGKLGKEVFGAEMLDKLAKGYATTIGLEGEETPLEKMLMSGGFPTEINIMLRGIADAVKESNYALEEKIDRLSKDVAVRLENIEIGFGELHSELNGIKNRLQGGNVKDLFRV